MSVLCVIWFHPPIELWNIISVLLHPSSMIDKNRQCLNLQVCVVDKRNKLIYCFQYLCVLHDQCQQVNLPSGVTVVCGYCCTAVLVTTAVTGDTAHGWSWSAAWPHETIYFIFDIGNILPSAPAPGAHWHLINTNTGSRVIDRYFQSSDWGHKRPFQWLFYVLPLQWFCSPT